MNQFLKSMPTERECQFLQDLERQAREGYWVDVPTLLLIRTFLAEQTADLTRQLAEARDLVIVHESSLRLADSVAVDLHREIHEARERERTLRTALEAAPSPVVVRDHANVPYDAPHTIRNFAAVDRWWVVTRGDALAASPSEAGKKEVGVKWIDVCANDSEHVEQPKKIPDNRGVCWVDLPAESQGADHPDHRETITLSRYSTNKPEAGKHPSQGYNYTGTDIP